MEPQLVSFDQMRTPEVIGQIGETNQDFVALSNVSTDWEQYIVEAAFVPAAYVSADKVSRPSLRHLAKIGQKFRRIFVEKFQIFNGV